MKGAGDGNENPDLQKLQEIKKNFDTMGAGRKTQRVGMTTSINEKRKRLQIRCTACGKTGSLGRQLSTAITSSSRFLSLHQRGCTGGGTCSLSDEYEPDELGDKGSQKRKFGRDGGSTGVGSLQQYMVSESQQTLAIQALSRFFFKRCVSLHNIDAPELREAFQHLGVTLPGRSCLSTTLLDAEYTRLKLVDEERVAKMPWICMATDCWKSRKAGSVPLLNRILLDPAGGSVFRGVVSCEGVIKSSQWLADKHEEWLMAEAGTEERVLGLIMDNTSANRKAMRILRERHPKWLTLGCSAHMLSLLFKDIVGGERVAKGKTPACDWTARVYAAALAISNTFNGTEHVRALVREHQRELYGKERAISTHCGTRFAVMHFISRDIIATREAITRAVTSQAWEAIASQGDRMFEAASTEVHWQKYTTGEGLAFTASFWTELDLVSELMQPVSDAIHSLEGDRCYLSQVLPVWLDLLEHAKAFDCKSGPRSDVYPLFFGRFCKHYDPSWAAAMLLDPVNASQDSDEDWTLCFESLDEKRGELKDAIMCISDLTGFSIQDVTVEINDLRLALPTAFSAQLPGMTVRRMTDEGRTFVCSTTKRRKLWTKMAATSHPACAQAADKLLSMHATSCAPERNWSLWGSVYMKGRSKLARERGEKLVYVRAHAGQVDRDSDEEI